MKHTIGKTFLGIFFILGFTWAIHSFGATLNSAQVGSNPQNGRYLQTNGATSTWASLPAGTATTSINQVQGPIFTITILPTSTGANAWTVTTSSANLFLNLLQYTSGTNINVSANGVVNFVNPGFVTSASSVTWMAPQIFNTTSTFNNTTTFNSSTIFSTVTNALHLGNASGVVTSYGGSNCSVGNAPTGINAVGSVQNCTSYLQTNQSITASLSQDATGTGSGTTIINVTTTVQGLEGKSLPAVTTGTLYYKGSQWNLGNAVDANGTQYVTSSAITIGGVTSSTFQVSNGITMSSTGTLGLSNGNSPFVLLGSSTLSSVGSVVSTTIPYASFIKIVLFINGTNGSNSSSLIFNNDANLDYGWRYSVNGAAQVTSTAPSFYWNFIQSPSELEYLDAEITNPTSTYKMGTINAYDATSTNFNVALTTAGGLWATSTAISSVEVVKNGGQTMGIGTSLEVFGY